MPTIHELLDESQKRCADLAKEIRLFKDARSLNIKTSESLESLCKALEKTSKEITPFSDIHIRRFKLFIVSTCAFNTILLIAFLLISLFSLNNYK